MKKIVTIFLLTLFILLCGSLIYSHYKDFDVNLSFYTIPKNYSIYKSTDKKILIDVYSNQVNSLISFKDNNRYQIIYNDHTIEIDEINIDCRKEISKDTTIYVYTYEINVNDFIGDVFNKQLIFKITNEEYSVKLNAGQISIYDKEYKVLDFKDLYGNYSYVDGELHMVGITIALPGKYEKLTNVYGGVCHGRIDSIIRDTLYPNEINLNDLENSKIIDKVISTSYELSNKDKYYFIPIVYDKLLLTLNPCFIFVIDNEEYLLDNFYYLYNDINLDKYDVSKKAGEINYVKVN